jgi:hypothetical protein
MIYEDSMAFPSLEMLTSFYPFLLPIIRFLLIALTLNSISLKVKIALKFLGLPKAVFMEGREKGDVDIGALVSMK